jgi:hypothetical protein
MAVWCVFAVGGAAAGWQVATAIGEQPPTVADTQTRTVSSTVVHRKTRFVTVHVRGKVIRRVDHILVVRVPRVVFHTRTTPRRRIVVPAHVVRIREKHPSLPGPPVEAAVVGVAPPPVTVTIPVTVAVPGPTETVTSTVVSTQLVPTTTTETSVTTLTVSVPLTDTGGSP